MVTNPELRERILRTRLPWRVVDRVTGIGFALIPPGQYFRGCRTNDPDAVDDEMPAHLVVITKPFYLGVTEVTNSQFRQFRPSHDGGREWGQSLNEDDQPVGKVSWEDARAFCDEFGFRLPTEGEWEYAYRAGTRSLFPWGDDLSGARGKGNVLDKGSGTRVGVTSEAFPWDDGYFVPSPVASFMPNGFGLYDMLGNMFEWCADWYSSTEYERCAGRVDDIRGPPSSLAVVDPTGPPRGVARVQRGTCFRYIPRYSRSSCRFSASPSRTRIDFGFRVARDP